MATEPSEATSGANVETTGEPTPGGAAQVEQPSGETPGRGASAAEPGEPLGVAWPMLGPTRARAN